MGFRMPETISSKILFPVVLKAANFLYQEFHGLDYTKGRKPLLKSEGVLFMANRMNDTDKPRLRDVFTREDIYNPVKKFGPISLVELKPWFNFYDPTTNLRITKGEPYLSIHIGPKNNTAPVTYKNFTEGMRSAGNYIRTHRDKLPQNYVIGITFRELAEASRRYGFSLAETPLPEKVKGRLRKIIKYNVSHKREVADVALCFQSYDDLIRRFNS